MENNFELYKETATKYMEKNREWYNLSHMNNEEFSHVCKLATSVMMTRDKVLQGGSFVQAVVDNNLSEAINRADDIAIQALKALVAVKRNCSIEQHQI